MKKITKNTFLKQGNKTYQPVTMEGSTVISFPSGEIDDKVDRTIIYWIETETLNKPGEPHITSSPKGDKIIAQSKPEIIGVPVINLDNYVETLFNDVQSSDNIDAKLVKEVLKMGYNSNPNQYTQKDIEKAIELAQMTKAYGDYKPLTKEEILPQINSISIIEVDEQFNIIQYE